MTPELKDMTVFSSGKFLTSPQTCLCTVHIFLWQLSLKMCLVCLFVCMFVCFCIKK